MSAEAGHSTSGKVGPKVQVTVTMAAGGMHVEWSPEIPDWQYLRKWIDDYRKVRDQAVGEWAQRNGIPIERILMVEN